MSGLTRDQFKKAMAILTESKGDMNAIIDCTDFMASLHDIELPLVHPTPRHFRRSGPISLFPLN